MESVIAAESVNENQDEKLTELVENTDEIAGEKEIGVAENEEVSQTVDEQEKDTKEISDEEK